MTTIDPGQRLAIALREQLAALREREAGRAQGAARADRTQGAGAGGQVALAQRIQALPPDDPDRPRKAVRLYLEARLAREFGRGLLNDPALPQLLDAVQQQMDEDAQTAAAVAALGRLLVAGRIGAA